MPSEKFSVLGRGLLEGRMLTSFVRRFPTVDQNVLATLPVSYNEADIALLLSWLSHRNLKSFCLDQGCIVSHHVLRMTELHVEETPPDIKCSWSLAKVEKSE